MFIRIRKTKQELFSIVDCFLRLLFVVIFDNSFIEYIIFICDSF